MQYGKCYYRHYNYYHFDCYLLTKNEKKNCNNNNNSSNKPGVVPMRQFYTIASVKGKWCLIRVRNWSVTLLCLSLSWTFSMCYTAQRRSPSMLAGVCICWSVWHLHNGQLNGKMIGAERAVGRVGQFGSVANRCLHILYIYFIYIWM